MLQYSPSLQLFTSSCTLEVKLSFIDTASSSNLTLCSTLLTKHQFYAPTPILSPSSSRTTIQHVHHHHGNRHRQDPPLKPNRRRQPRPNRLPHRNLYLALLLQPRPQEADALRRCRRKGRSRCRQIHVSHHTTMHHRPSLSKHF